MKNKKTIIIFIVVVLVIAIAAGIWRFLAIHAFNLDGTILTHEENHQELINNLELIENRIERERNVKYAEEKNLISEEEARYILEK